MRSPIIASLATVALVAPAAAENPFEALIGGGKEACFRRVYDEAHLKSNPRQQVTTMTVWITGKLDQLQSGNTGLALTRRGDPEALFLSGDCQWGNFEGPPDWMPTFKKEKGAGCVTSAVPDVFIGVSSAEEGGAAILDPAPDGKTLMVHLDDPSLVTRAKRWEVAPVTFGPDDRVFKLDKADLAACAFIIEALTTLEPPHEGPEE